MKKIVYIGTALSLLILVSLSSSLTAQVTIGKNMQAPAYSLLQVELDAEKFPYGAGVLLSRLSAVQRDALVLTSDPEAVGLTIYNTDTKKLECWNGTEWIPVTNTGSVTFSATNGLTTRADLVNSNLDYVGLGGNLTEATTIGTQGFALGFTQSATEKFQVKNTKGEFTVVDKRVGIGTEAPAAKLDIAKAGTSTSGFRLVDGNQAFGRVLTADAQGYGTWKEIPPYVDTEINDLTTEATLAYNTDVNVGSITCKPGTWLIIGKYNMRESDTDTGNLYTWAKLVDNATGNILSVAGVKTEKTGQRWSNPEVVYYGTFLGETTINFLVNGPRADTSGGTILPLKIEEDGAQYGNIRALRLGN